MLRLGVSSKKRPREVLTEAERFLGGQGLEVVHRAIDRLTFRGGGGFVDVAVTTADGTTEVDLSTQEWETAIRQLARRLAS